MRILAQRAFNGTRPYYIITPSPIEANNIVTGGMFVFDDLLDEERSKERVPEVILLTYRRVQRIAFADPKLSEELQDYVVKCIQNKDPSKGLGALAIAISRTTFEPLSAATPDYGWLDIGDFLGNVRILIDGLRRFSALQKLRRKMDINDLVRLTILVYEAPTDLDKQALFEAHNSKAVRLLPHEQIHLDGYGQLLSRLAQLPVFVNNGGIFYARDQAWQSGKPKKSLGKKDTRLIADYELYRTLRGIGGEKVQQDDRMTDDTVNEGNLDLVIEAIGSFFTRYAEKAGKDFAPRQLKDGPVKNSVYHTTSWWQALGQLLRNIFVDDFGHFHASSPETLDRVVTALNTIDWGPSNPELDEYRFVNPKGKLAYRHSGGRAKVEWLYKLMQTKTGTNAPAGMAAIEGMVAGQAAAE